MTRLEARRRLEITRKREARHTSSTTKTTSEATRPRSKQQAQPKLFPRIEAVRVSSKANQARNEEHALDLGLSNAKAKQLYRSRCLCTMRSIMTSWRKEQLRKREASKRERSAVDKSKEAVRVRVQALFDEAEHRFSGREARLKREEKRAKLVFPDPETVGFNLPAHLVGDSADYRTKERAPGTNKDGFTEQEVSQTPTHTH